MPDVISQSDAGSPSCPYVGILDSFDTLDLGEWGRAAWMVGDTQFFADDAHATASGGQAVLNHIVVNGGPPWEGAEIYRLQSQSFGSYRARMKVPDVSGLVCAFFTYVYDSNGKSHEIDVEILSANPNQVWFSSWRDWDPSCGWDNNPYHHYQVYEDAGLDVREFHTYGFDWTPSSIAFFVDPEINPDPVTSWSDAVPRTPAPMRFNFWTSSKWSEVEGPPIEDASMLIDWVSYSPLPTSFDDVCLDHWGFAEIEACTGAGIVQGYPDGSYQPDVAVSREQMAIYISRGLAGGDENVPTGPAQSSFADVPSDDIAYKYIEYAHANDIVFGYPSDGLYHPEYDVDRGQMSVFVARAIATPTGEPGMAGYTPPATPTFADVTSDPLDRYNTCYKYVEYIVEHDVTRGYPDGLYHPEYTVSRGLMAIYVTRAFGLI